MCSSTHITHDLDQTPCENGRSCAKLPNSTAHVLMYGTILNWHE